MRRAGILLVMHLLLIIPFSCREEGSVADEGMIKYKIDYLDYDKSNILLGIMPERMTVTFKDNSTRLEIKSVYGVFKFAQISNKREGINVTLLKILDKKYKYQQDIDSIAAAFESMRNLQLNMTGETKMIAGYECKKVNARINNKKHSMEFPVFSTNEIDINQPNKNNPFHELNEVLLEFQLTLKDIRMRLSATEIKKAKVEKSDFVVPDDYKEISKQEMSEIIGRFTSNDAS